MIKIKFDNTDDHGFKEIVESIIRNLILSLHPKEIAIVRIKNWFDHKWLNYSGKAIYKNETGTNAMIPLVSEPCWSKEITIPPFNPNRVLSETIYRLYETENPKFEELLHVSQNSNDNVKRIISELTKNGICIWISSNSETNKQGSVMVYQIQNSEVITWYLNIEDKNGWKITKSKGIDKNTIQSMLTQ
ncbi:hypothetical protein [Winogradskyella forsetii]|uniref:hypothetical protein n=1 Tax=Winogradskyella forsetii TaxID=2686077 RepID=UPI0015B8E780|nr:hypothetical protein [Winogradskyella forsetii]